MAMEYFLAYHSYLKSIEPLSDAERGRLFTAMLEYSITGAEPELRGAERYIFPTMKVNIDRDTAKYNAKCQAQSMNGKKGGRPRKPKNPRLFSESQKSQKSQEEEKDKDKDKEEEKDKDKEYQLASELYARELAADDVLELAFWRGGNA